MRTCEPAREAKSSAQQGRAHFHSPDSGPLLNILQPSPHSIPEGLRNFKKPAEFQPYRIRYSMS
jgi:hypothetical protein